MDKQMLTQMWDQLRQKYGVYLRLLETIPEDRFFTSPIAGTRSPAALVVHVSGSIVRDIALGVAKGRITSDESGEDTIAKGLGTKAAVLAYARDAWDQAARAVENIGDAQLNALVPTPWNMTFPGWVGFNILNDEFVHHRGQLYTYARACGVAPPFVWGFAENAPQFQPPQRVS